jgi:4-hydroxyphenylacetate 3-monooxygenase
VARRLTEAIGTTRIPSVSEELGYLAAQASMIEAMLSGMEASGSRSGEYWVPNKHLMYSAQVLTQDLYPQFVNAIRELSGGALIMLPSSINDFEDPLLRKIIHTTQRAAEKACWDAVGSEFGSRHQQYEMFYAGARFVTAGHSFHSFRTYDWNGATGLVQNLLASYALGDELAGH